MLRILVAYLFWLPALVGLGSVPFRWVSQKPKNGERFPLEGVVGLMILGVFGAMIHLFLPISALLSLSFGVLGWLSFIVHYKGYVKSVRIRDVGIGLALTFSFRSIFCTRTRSL